MKTQPKGSVAKGFPGIQKNSENSKGSLRDEVHL